MATKKRGGARKGTGAKPSVKESERLTVGCIRMNAEQWKLFAKWGGAARLRQHMDKVKGGVVKNA